MGSGDELVLARLTVNSRGVISGIGQSQAALSQGKASLKEFGASQTVLGGATSTLITRMFSLRSVLLTVGRAFGIAGIVAGLAFAIKDLIRDAITGTDWFRRFSSSLGDWYNSVVKGETAVDALRRKVQEALKGTSITSPFTDAETIAGLEKSRKALQELLDTAVKPGTIEFGRILRSIRDVDREIDRLTTGIEPFNDMLKRMGLRDPIEQLGQLSATLARVNREASASILPLLLKQIGEQAAALQKQGVLLPPELLGLVPREKPEKHRTPGDIVGGLSAQQRFDLLPEEVATPITQEQIDLMIEAHGTVQRFTDQMYLLNESANITRGSFSDIFDEETWERLGISIADATVKIGIMNAAVQAIGQAFATSLVEGGKGMREAIANALKDLAVYFAVQALGQLAFGIAASTPWGFAVLGPPAPYFAAAKLFGVAAAAAGAGAAVLGGGGGSDRSSGGGGGGGGRNRLGGSAGGSSVTIVVQGSVIGTDLNELARELGKLIEVSREDGGRS